MTRVLGIEFSLRLYANDHGGRLPESHNWQQILMDERGFSARYLVCPAKNGSGEPDYSDYVLVPWPKIDWAGKYSEVEQGDLLLVFEQRANHSGKRCAATLGGGTLPSGHVVALTELEFQSKLFATKKALRSNGIDFNWEE